MVLTVSRVEIVLAWSQACPVKNETIIIIFILINYESLVSMFSIVLLVIVILLTMMGMCSLPAQVAGSSLASCFVRVQHPCPPGNWLRSVLTPLWGTGGAAPGRPWDQLYSHPTLVYRHSDRHV